MAAEHALYLDLAYVYGAALVGGLIARKLKQPLIIGYVLGGICVGPFTPGPRVSSAPGLELLAEIGVILLMYAIGIEFSPRELLRVKGVALIGGPLGIALTVALTAGVGHLMGWSFLQSVTVGAAVSVASTMVMSRLLIDRKELQTEHGRVMIGITLVEDLAVVLMTVLLPTLKASGTQPIGDLLLRTAGAVAALVPIAVAARWTAPRVLRRVSRYANPELYVLTALALGFITAAITQRLGLSLALGAFLAGMTLSGTPAAHETLRRLAPLRDAFVALFFVTVGTLIDPSVLLRAPALTAVLIAIIVVGKLVIWTLLVRIFRYRLGTAFRVGLGLTQIGEFSFVLVKVGLNSGLIGDSMYQSVLAASLLTILLNAALLRGADRLLPPIPAVVRA